MAAHLPNGVPTYGSINQLPSPPTPLQALDITPDTYDPTLLQSLQMRMQFHSTPPAIDSITVALDLHHHPERDLITAAVSRKLEVGGKPHVMERMRRTREQVTKAKPKPKPSQSQSQSQSQAKAKRFAFHIPSSSHHLTLSPFPLPLLFSCPSSYPTSH